MNGYNFTEHMRQLLAESRNEARRLKHEYVGTEHLLLSLIREEKGAAGTILTRLNADPAKIGQDIESVVRQGKAEVTHVDLPYTSRARKALELSIAEANDLGHDHVGGEHLLLGLLREDKGIAAQVLNHAGVSLEAARTETIKLVEK